MQRQQILIVAAVFYASSPITYRLNDLRMEYKGHFTEERLRRSPIDPTDPRAWVIDKIIMEKKVYDKKKKTKITLFSCRFLGYGKKFDRWKEASSISHKVMDKYNKTKSLKRLAKDLAKINN